MTERNLVAKIAHLESMKQLATFEPGQLSTACLCHARMLGASAGRDHPLQRSLYFSLFRFFCRCRSLYLSLFLFLSTNLSLSCHFSPSLSLYLSVSPPLSLSFALSLSLSLGALVQPNILTHNPYGCGFADSPTHFNMVRTSCSLGMLLYRGTSLIRQRTSLGLS